MKRPRFTGKQIDYALRQAEAGIPVSDMCRQMGIAEATYYIWCRKYANLGVSELRQLQEENARPKRIVADLTLDKKILSRRDPKKGLTRSLVAQYASSLIWCLRLEVALANNTQATRLLQSLRVAVR